jgi:hypothetical protein
MNIEQQLSHLTTRLLVQKSDGIHTGTGFFVAFDLGNDRSKVFCVTNRHVLSGASVCSMPFTFADDANNPMYGNGATIDVADIAESTIFHPDGATDLAAFPVHGILNQIVERGAKPFLKALNRRDIPDQTLLGDLNVTDDVLMVGYPNGLFDQHNNMPIVRRGITATSPALNFNGKSEFVIDCACFPGSSGSPVFLHQPMGHRTKEGDMMLGGGRTILIGVLYAGPQVSVKGDIVARTIPTSQQVGVESMIMMHLGFCIKATELAFLDEHV